MQQLQLRKTIVNTITYLMLLSITAIVYKSILQIKGLEPFIIVISILAVFLGGGVTALYCYYLNSKTKVSSKISPLNSLHREKAFRAIQECAVTVEAQEQMLDNMITMADQLSGLSFWIKDKDDRYAFADKTLRECLFKGAALKDVIGKTDCELKNSPECNVSELETLFKLINPQDYPDIPPRYFAEKLVCNVTDVITRCLKKPCRFYECIGDQVYDVWKSPIIENGEIVGTTGALVNITAKKDYWTEGLRLAEIEGEAFRIDSTEHFYIKRYGFSTDIPDKGLEVYLKKAFFKLKEQQK